MSTKTANEASAVSSAATAGTGMKSAGPKPSAPLHQVTVRLTQSELGRLDRERAPLRLQRGPYIRYAAFAQLPRSIPLVNQTAWARVVLAMDHLERVADSLADDPVFDARLAPDVASIARSLAEVRRNILGLQPTADAAR